MTKPIGSRCNLDCSYCFYLEKEKLYTDVGGMRMKPEVLETYVRDYIAALLGSQQAPANIMRMPRSQWLPSSIGR